MLNPLTHSESAEAAATYRVEPYVVAADVYTAEGHVGRGGWTWYTGSASWMYRVGLESLLGFRKRGDTLTIDPRVPESWDEFVIEYRHVTSRYTIVVRQPGLLATRGAVVTIDGEVVEDGVITLMDDGAEHRVEVRPKE
jgi:cyclic beta-1,2-glucan synthetase